MFSTNLFSFEVIRCFILEISLNFYAIKFLCISASVRENVVTRNGEEIFLLLYSYVSSSEEGLTMKVDA